MINKDFVSMLKRAVLPDKVLQDHSLTSPSREWIIGLTVAALFIVATAFWSANTYFRYQHLSSEQGQQPETEVVVYRKNLVDAALSEFEKKEQRRQQLLGQPYVLPVDDASAETDSADTPEGEEGGESSVVATSSLDTLEPPVFDTEETAATTSASITNNDTTEPSEPAEPTPEEAFAESDVATSSENVMLEP